MTTTAIPLIDPASVSAALCAAYAHIDPATGIERDYLLQRALEDAGTPTGPKREALRVYDPALAVEVSSTTLDCAPGDEHWAVRLDFDGRCGGFTRSFTTAEARTLARRLLRAADFYEAETQRLNGLAIAQRAVDA